MKKNRDKHVIKWKKFVYNINTRVNRMIGKSQKL